MRSRNAYIHILVHIYIERYSCIYIYIYIYIFSYVINCRVGSKTTSVALPPNQQGRSSTASSRRTSFSFRPPSQAAPDMAVFHKVGSLFRGADDEDHNVVGYVLGPPFLKLKPSYRSLQTFVLQRPL